MTAGTISSPTEVSSPDSIETIQNKSNEIDSEQDEICSRLISELTDDEKEHAARDSYRYLVASTSSDSPSPKEERDAAAKGLARRHLIRYKGNEDVALKKLKATIAFRKEYKADELRLSFYEENPDEDMFKLREDLDKQMESGSMYVKGIDKKNRAILRMDLGLNVGPWDVTPYVQNHVYNYERALACTERLSNGTEEKIIVVVSFQGYGRKNSPPLACDKAVMTCFGLHWPERLEKAFIVDAPLLFRIIYKLLKPFIDSDTTSRVEFVTGEDEILNTVGEYIDVKEQLSELFLDEPMTIDAKKFMYEIPYDRTVDGE